MSDTPTPLLPEHTCRHTLAHQLQALGAFGQLWLHSVARIVGRQPPAVTPRCSHCGGVL